MTSAATKQLVLFLTRPLMRVYPAAKLVALKLCLHTALAPSTLGVATTLYLSASCPPPPALQRACALAGVRWADWIKLLSGGVDLRVFVHGTALAVQVGAQPRRTLWAAAPAVAPFEARRGRCSLGAAALHPTRVPTLLSIAFAPPCAAADEPSSDDDGASDAESDAGSDASDCTSASASSASTAATSVCSAAPAPSCAEPACAAPPPTRYLYQGGVTTVASGRVLLGVARAPDATSPPPAPRRPSSAPPALTARKPGETWRSPAVARTQTDSRSGWRKADTADSWRRPAQAAIAI
ncbi:hypothetical protein GGX14DRAFT_652691 [Mycena pura]|uniref:Uncharacterized protein n=1 Tax=Mycena pura TaxID=153505 RepID=A0AAD6VCI6_9AGAR|nr:hypothetical protein GGX14DRAFT_652691 [Mycena pura]